MTNQLTLIYIVLFVSCFLLLLLPFYFFVRSFIENYVFCYVFLVSSGVRQLLSRATETKTVRKEANRQEKKAHRCKWAFKS